MSKIRVLIVEDHPLMREALGTAIETEADLELVGQAANGQQAVEMASALNPDVIVMDLFLPILDGVKAIAEIIQADPEKRILAMTSSTEDSKVAEAIGAGALGYLLKDASREQFLAALRAVAFGRSFLLPDVAQKLVAGMRQAAVLRGHAAEQETLTPREQEILKLVGEGLSNRSIAQQLFLSEATVRVHLYHILQKLGLDDRGQAIVYAMKKARE